MGKKKNASASGTTKVSRDWGASTISNREVSKLRALGFIFSSDDDICLLGPSSHPNPPKGFTVMFVAFLFRGLSLPAHEFLRSLLFFYGIQLWQLTPNSILHLSIFITVCEAFLGIDPHWGLWRTSMSSVTMTTMPPSSVALASFSDDDDDVPLAKRAKLSSGKPESGKKSNPSPAKSTPPSRTTVEKIPVSKVIPSGNIPVPPAARDHPIYATVDAVVDFDDQFTRLESENAHLRKTIKTSADQVLEANKLATDAQNENILLKDELKKLKQKDEG
ncbi:hypothetical protein QYE76_052359 [Lolium multiflorum]|uniref:Transposase (putative) gypsy type domain-containing protein n=1 Tax=Lolium multiflorum TaxID=4521 RepID=A0AAD8SV71_LOLMU|nr:hypothetical protein QYE76_052359 [Lolium multiflorum]